MDNVALLRQDVAIAHNVFMGTIADVTPQVANWLPPGVAPNIAGLYAHVLHAEDMVVQGMFQGKPSLWERDGWGKKLGVAFGAFQTPEWNRSVRIRDLGPWQSYAQAVFAATDAYVAGLAPSDLDRKIDAGEGLGQQTLAWLVQAFVCGNVVMHTGEISALKGCQGKKGYPF